MQTTNKTTYGNNLYANFQSTQLKNAVGKSLLPIAITAATFIGAKTSEINDLFVKQDKQPVKAE